MDETVTRCPRCGNPHLVIDDINLLDMTVTVVCWVCGETSVDVPQPVLPAQRRSPPRQ